MLYRSSPSCTMIEAPRIPDDALTCLRRFVPAPQGLQGFAVAARSEKSQRRCPVGIQGLRLDLEESHFVAACFISPAREARLSVGRSR